MLKPIIILAALCTATLASAAEYTVNFPADATIADRGRSLNSVGIDEQTAEVGQKPGGLLYHNLCESAVFSVNAAQTVKPVMDWTGDYMHGYVYVDLNNDGTFDPLTELISYTYKGGKNSIAQPAGDNAAISTLPEFVVPALAAGDYRLRYKIDWNDTEPGGSTAAGNDILANGGAIADAILRVVEPTPEATEHYKVNFDADSRINHANRRLNGITLKSALYGTQSVDVNQAEDMLLYHDCTATSLIAPRGEQLTVGLNWSGTWMNAYLYIDRAGNGDFSHQVSEANTLLPGSDLIAFSNYKGKNSLGNSTGNGNNLTIPSFYMPGELAPGSYRARVKIDWDNIDPAGDAEILKNGGAVVDFTLVVPEKNPESAVIKPMAMNGLLLAADGSPLTEIYARGRDLTVKALPTLPGYAADALIVRHGEGANLADDRVEIGEDGLATIPGTMINSNEITIYALFAELPDSEWQKVWGDEFNSGALDSRKWNYQGRANATWCRFVAQGKSEQKLVNTFEDGCYNSWCIPTPSEFTDETQPMISGAINSQNKFDITYGKIEARIKTTPHTGNFPAFWMMPTVSSDGGWPCSGEIDIWEQIDTDDRAHSTVHSGWTGWRAYCGWTDAPKQGSPQSTSNVYTDAAAWHVYALEWDSEELRWYVDGQQTFSYPNKHYSEEGTNYTEQICWPFYKNFYIILNQSVGNGSWARPADTSFTYKTLFDYVRVYKLKGDNGYDSKVTDNGDDANFYVPLNGKPDSSIVEINAEGESPVRCYDLRGNLVSSPRARGVYLLVSDNSVTKIIR